MNKAQKTQIDALVATVKNPTPTHALVIEWAVVNKGKGNDWPGMPMSQMPATEPARTTLQELLDQGVLEIVERPSSVYPNFTNHYIAVKKA